MKLCCQNLPTKTKQNGRVTGECPANVCEFAPLGRDTVRGLDPPATFHTTHAKRGWREGQSEVPNLVKIGDRQSKVIFTGTTTTSPFALNFQAGTAAPTHPTNQPKLGGCPVRDSVCACRVPGVCLPCAFLRTLHTCPKTSRSERPGRILRVF